MRFPLRHIFIPGSFIFSFSKSNQFFSLPSWLFPFQLIIADVSVSVEKTERRVASEIIDGIFSSFKWRVMRKDIEFTFEKMFEMCLIPKALQKIFIHLIEFTKQKLKFSIILYKPKYASSTWWFVDPFFLLHFKSNFFCCI